jgi:hypothetical protein
MQLAANRLFRRCVQCPQVVPPCPSCKSDEICNLSSQSCDTCPSTSCVKASTTSPSSLPAAVTSKPVNSGAVAGGVIAGVAVIGLMVFLVWRFCIKNRRQEYEDDNWPNESESTPSTAKVEQDTFSARRDARASTHTVGSIASTVLTRASNVIQIAYIPGVTNRSPPQSPGLLIPPVPPIPSVPSPNSSANTTPNYHQDQHFFMPSDLRDSTYSGMSDDRRSMARSSVATTIYRNNAVINPVPAQTIVRGKAAVVSVKSSGPNSPLDSPTSDAPPVPLIDYERHHANNLLSQDDMRAPPSPAFSIGSTFMKSTADTAKAVTAKPIRVKKSAGSLTLTPLLQSNRGQSSGSNSSPLSSTPSASTSDAPSDAANTHGRSKQSPSLLDADASPFGDQQQAPSPGAPAGQTPRSSSLPKRRESAQASGHKVAGSLSAVIEEATRRASRQPTHGGLGSVKRENSPFSDIHELGPAA